MHWTVYALIGLILLAALGFAIRRLLIHLHVRDHRTPWYRHANQSCFIDDYSLLFYSRIRARIPLPLWLLLAAGLACLLPGWFGWLSNGLTILLDILGLLLVLLTLLSMRLWPWSPAWLTILKDSVYVDAAGGSRLWFSDSRASISYSESSNFSFKRSALNDLLTPETLLFERTREGNMSAADRQLTRSRKPKYSITRADLGEEGFGLVLEYLRKTGHIY